MDILEILKTSPGFVYEIGGQYYFLGKWICRPCTDPEITDCAVMYHICLDSGETREASLYFQKLRAYSDFALEVPYNPAKIHSDMEKLAGSLSGAERVSLEKQISRFLGQDS